MVLVYYSSLNCVYLPFLLSHVQRHVKCPLLLRKLNMCNNIKNIQVASLGAVVFAHVNCIHTFLHMHVPTLVEKFLGYQELLLRLILVGCIMSLETLGIPEEF